MSIIFLFIDGVGLGEEKEENPFHLTSYKAFLRMAGGQPFTKEAKPLQKDGQLFKAVDANLGVKGLPQSGTGQTALFTGVNASKEIGKHFGPFPHSGIKHLLREQSIFLKAQRQGKSCHFINAYPDVFFEKARKRNRWSCTTLMTKSAGLPLNTTKTVKEGKAVTAGITQQAWREMLEIDVSEINPQEAANRLLERAKEYDLVLYEYYLTDKAGHNQVRGDANLVLERYDQFLMHIIKEKRKEDTLVLCSDHGNIEDLNTKTHTRNKVPLYVEGPGAETFAKVESILDVTPGVLKVLME